ncbi:ATP-binding protein [Microcoleus sp. B3-A4]|uniref:ATP-binding protein n=1 Tax=Microcoleus sp. B3-A4 TaxID=2818653 RepID=UPI002FD392E6
MSNPFNVGKPVPPEQFVGRSYEIAAAFDQIYNRAHLALWGGSGMGKTSFLELLASPQAWNKNGLDPSQAAIVLLNCENIIPFTPSGFWREVLSLMKDNLGSEPGLQGEIETLLQTRKTTKDSLRQVLGKLGQKNKFLVLLVDDYDAALRPNEQYTEAEMEQFVTECRSFAVHCPERKYLSMIVASLKRLNELGPQLRPNASPWYNHYLFQSLKPFNKKEIAQLLGGIPMKPELRDAIDEIASGHPRFLQMAGFFIYRELRTGKRPDVQAFITDFERDTQPFFHSIWARCSEQQQTLLMLMALSHLKGRLHHKKQFDLRGMELIFSQRERELTKLEEAGVITRVAEGRVPYSFTSSIMERLVIQEIWNSDQVFLQERQKVFLNLMSHDQVKKFQTAINWLWTNKNEVPSTLVWLTKLVAAFNGFIS